MNRHSILGGYILFARKTFEGFLMDKPPLWLKLWVWMLCKANFKDRDKLKRGQLFTTITDMQEAMSYKIGYRKKIPTRDQIRNAYEAFAKTTMITTTKTTRGIIITFCNYDHYQNPKNYETHSEDHNENTTKPTVTPHDTERKNKERKKKGNIPPISPLVEYPDWLNQNLWKEFKKMRIKIKSPLTEHAEKMNITSLKKLIDQGYDQKDIINQTIANGWKGFWPLSDNHQKTNQGQALHQRGYKIQPQTYSQAQDAERRDIALSLLKEEENESNTKNDQQGIEKAIGLLPSS